MAGGTEARTHRVLKVIFYPEEHSKTRVAGGRRRRIPPPQVRPHAPDMNPPTFRFPPFNGGPTQGPWPVRVSCVETFTQFAFDFTWQEAGGV